MRNKIMMAILFIAISGMSSSQNVGIGTNNPTRAKLEVHGVAGVGGTTAIFGAEGAGVSMQIGWPTVGFNQYLDDAATYGKYMANGYAAIQYLHPAGILYFDIFPSGTKNTLTGPATGRLELNHSGKLTVRGGLHLATHEVTSDKCGVGNNMLPIAMTFVQSNGSKSGGTTNVTTSFVTDHYVIQLTETVTGTIPAITVLSGSALNATYVLGKPTEIWVYIWSGNTKVQSGFSITVFKP